MAESWIRVHANIADKPVVWRAMEALAVKQAEAVGLLVTFWGAVSQHAPNGQVAHLLDAQLESWAGWRGKRGRFAGFIRAKHLDDDGRVNEWDEYAGALEDARERAREKKRRQREARRAKMGLSPGCPAVVPADVPASVLGDVPGTSLPTRRDETRRDDRTTQSIAPADADDRPSVAWPARLAEVWSGLVGAMTPGRIGKALKPAVDRHGAERVEQAMRAFVANQKRTEKPCQLAWFANNAQVWIERTAQPLDVVDGEMTDTLELRSRP